MKGTPSYDLTRPPVVPLQYNSIAVLLALLLLPLPPLLLLLPPLLLFLLQGGALSHNSVFLSPFRL